MQKFSEVTIIQYIYDSEEERNEHIEKMKKHGWEVSPQIKIDFIDNPNKYYWYGKFFRKII